MIEYLKVKVVSLAAEAALIRREEHRLKWRFDPRAEWRDKKTGGVLGTTGMYVKRRRTDRQSAALVGLTDHRKGIVRSEARVAQLAYAFIRGRDYGDVERPTRNPLTVRQKERVKELVWKYGRRIPRLSNATASQYTVDSAIEAWLSGKYSFQTVDSLAA